MKKVEIKCDSKNYIELSKFKELQGNLKDLTEANYNKLKESILKYGFISPFFSWFDGKTYWILDAHQRYRVLTNLEKDGYDIPKLPTVLIEAKDKRTAKEILLTINSKYGKMTAEGLYEFINEVNFEIDFDNIKAILDFPDLDLNSFDLGFNKDIEVNDNNAIEQSNLYSKEIKAPIYEPKNEKPSIWDIYNTDKKNQLEKDIESANITNEERIFLRAAANRHIIFHFDKIADYYSHSNKEMQTLMEKSGLVIIDFEKAIENGFVKLSKDIANLAEIDYDEE